MDVRIIIKGVVESGVLREYAEEKVAAAMRRFERKIHSLTVRLEDENGPRKQGLDKQCRIETHLRPSGEVVIKEHSEDMQAALLTALDRLKAAISRKAGRMKRGIGHG